MMLLVRLMLYFSLLVFLYIGSLYLFCRGFLLSRIELSNISHCNSSPLSFSFQSFNHSINTNKAFCNIEPTFPRVIILLVDALRFDFAACPPGASKHHPLPPYLGRLPHLCHLVTDRPHEAALYRFVADPPTTTLQRLKAIVTGSLPTFVDAGSNFGAADLSGAVDNLVEQLARSGRRVVFMGDDTWTSLFPTQFARSFSYPSFNVKDLHTVDNGVISHLYDEMQKSDWDLIVAHMLGVDHCGHRYGANHAEMASKLSQVNAVIENVTRMLEEERALERTLLLVFGDHGMTHGGDHGGDSAAETDSALFAFSPTPTPDGRASDQHRDQLVDFRRARQLLGKPTTVGEQSSWSVSQMDLVPTLSLLMGVPVPFSSLGMAIPEFFVAPSPASDAPLPLERLVRALAANARQLQLYLRTYVRHAGDFPGAEFDELERLFRELDARSEKLLGPATTFSASASASADSSAGTSSRTQTQAHQELQQLVHAYERYFERVRATCRRIWSKFDVPLMAAGLLSFALALLWHLRLDLVALARASATRDRDPHTSSQGPSRALVLPAALHLVALSVVLALLATDLAENTELLAIAVFSLAILVGALVLGLRLISCCTRLCRRSSAEAEASSRQHPSAKSRSAFILPNVYSLVQRHWPAALLALYASGFFSNSMLVNESAVALFLLQTAQCLVVLDALVGSCLGVGAGARGRAWRVFGVGCAGLLSARLAANFSACREEQSVRFCNRSEEFFQLPIHDAALSVNERNVKFALGVLAAFAPYYIYKRALENSANWSPLSSIPVKALVRYLFFIQFVCTFGYWVLEALLAHRSSSSSSTSTSTSSSESAANSSSSATTSTSSPHTMGLENFLPRLVYSLSVTEVLVVVLWPQEFAVFVRERPLTPRERMRNLLEERASSAQNSSVRSLYKELFAEQQENAAAGPPSSPSSPSTPSSTSASPSAADANSAGSQGNASEPVVYALGLSTLLSANLMTLLLAFVHPLILLLGIEFAPGLFCLLVTLYCILEVSGFSSVSKDQYKSSESGTSEESAISVLGDPVIALAALVASHGFVNGTGHQAALANIRWSAAFVGFSHTEATFWIQALLVLANTFSASILVLAALPIFALRQFREWYWLSLFLGDSSKPSKGTKSTSDSSEDSGIQVTELTVFQNPTSYLLRCYKLFTRFLQFQAVVLFTLMCVCAVHRRHLMLWKVFGPRFLFASVQLLVSVPVGALVLLLVGILLYRLRVWFSELEKGRVSAIEVPARLQR